MKKLLYIMCNSKPEHASASKTVGREFVKRFMLKNPEYQLDELDLYSADIPSLRSEYFGDRAKPVSGAAYQALGEDDKKAVDTIEQLSDQFLAADLYVIAAPMWSVSFPAKLKEYFDCVIIQGKTIDVDPQNNKVTGLLDDKERAMVYVQSSGGDFPMLLSSKLNHGITYTKDIFKFLGVKTFKKLLVEGTGDPEIGREAAIQKAIGEIDDLVESLS